jgi:hypothetical protein
MGAAGAAGTVCLSLGIWLVLACSGTANIDVSKLFRVLFALGPRRFQSRLR